jgi:hypothetical protein
MPMPTPSQADEILSPADMDALTRAVEQQRARGGERKRQIEDMLTTRPWLETAKFAAYSLQCSSLALKPWETAPLDAEPDDRDSPGNEARRIGSAARLVRRLLAAGLSRYEVDPLGALARAKGIADTPVA